MIYHKHRMVIVVTLFILMKGGWSKKKDMLKASVQLIEKEVKKVDVSSCKSTTETSLAKLRLHSKNNQAVTCLIKLLSTNPEKGWAWSELGQQYGLAQEKSKATTCFKQATKLDGKLSKFIKRWHFIGPFVIGKIEVDGDPMQSYGGIRDASKERFSKKVAYYSELVKGGEIHWKVIEQKSAGERLQISADNVPWNELVSSLGSFAITEWQGWLVGEFAVNSKDEDVLIQCLGVHTIYVDNQFVAADVYRRNQYWYGISLAPGIHTVYIRLRSKGPQVLECNIKLAASNKFEVHSPSMVPHLVEGHLVGSVLALPITNLQTSKWLKNIRITLSSQGSGPRLEVTQPKHIGPTHIAPGQTMPVAISIQEVVSGGNKECTDAVLTLKVTASDSQNQELPVTLKCRKRGESFLFTFVDHDGSVQSAAAIMPLQDCPDRSCPVLLSLHGTGVEAQNQADSYKRMEDGQWFFGLETAWVLTPTRHGAHNWEGPGALTSMTALETLQQLTHELSWIPNKADASRVIFAGHSMGGHGAWHLATHYPDRALAVISLAGWIKKEEYGDSNIFFRHDISASHTDPAVKAILEACIAENDADRHVSNLKGIPVLSRIGAQDRTVHPFFVRRMYRLLQEVGINVTYTELPGKEHWWWDTWTTNDGGAINDPHLRKFANQVAESPTPTTASCDANGLDCVQENYPLRYSGIDKLEHSGKWTLTVVNPALGEGLLGIRVLQQTVPFRTSKIEMEFPEPTKAVVKTINVDRLSLSQTRRVSPGWYQRAIEIDGTSLDLRDIDIGTNAGAIELCKQKGKWQVCVEETLQRDAQVRLPGNLGPARRVAEHQFIIVVGTQDKSKSQALLNMAVYIANLFYLTSDTIAPIVEDESLTGDKAESHNLIVIGGPSENQWTQGFLDKVPLSSGQSGLSLGDCTFDEPDLGALFLAPHRHGGLALVILGTSMHGLEDAVRLATPTIPPMTRSPFSNLVPDFIVTGPEFQAKGPGGYLCTGFWGNQWEYRRELASCVC